VQLSARIVKRYVKTWKHRRHNSPKNSRINLLPPYEAKLVHTIATTNDVRRLCACSLSRYGVSVNPIMKMGTKAAKLQHQCMGTLSEGSTCRMVTSRGLQRRHSAELKVREKEHNKSEHGSAKKMRRCCSYSLYALDHDVISTWLYANARCMIRSTFPESRALPQRQ
jgi:hypothetical protein